MFLPACRPPLAGPVTAGLAPPFSRFPDKKPKFAVLGPICPFLGFFTFFGFFA
jgi:hypothetical protein